LIANLGELSKAVRQHPKRYTMPEKVSEDALQAIRQLSLKADERNKALAELTKDLTKLQQDETTANQRIASRQEAKQRAQDQKADLEKQRMGYLDQISRLEHGNEGGIVDLASIEDQRQKLSDVTGRIEALNEQITKADADIRDTLAQIQKYKDKTAEKKREVLTLNSESKVIQEALAGRREILKMADDQEELRSLEIRVHKRLAQAFAVLAFAMIGIPLGIMTKRRSIMIAFGISFGVVLLLFYPFLIIGQMAAESGLLPTVPAIWSGNALTFMIGLALTVHVLRK
jgi:lipopolysaccharide export LptBFGC system permease protein LptF